LRIREQSWTSEHDVTIDTGAWSGDLRWKQTVRISEKRQEEPLASVREADLQPPCPAKPALDRLQSLFGAPGTALTVRQLKPSLMGRDDDPTRSHGIVISMLLPGDAGPYGEA